VKVNEARKLTITAKQSSQKL